MKSVLLLTMAVTLSVAACRAAPKSWTVVATQSVPFESAPTLRILRIDDISPSGGVAYWQRTTSTSDAGVWANPQAAQCWQSARVGEALPQCAREEPAPPPVSPTPQQTPAAPTPTLAPFPSLR